MYDRRQKPWVSQLAMPWIIIYFVACAASLVALGHKLQLLAKALRARADPEAAATWPISANGTVNLGGIAIAEAFSSHASVRDLRKRLEDNQQKIYTLYLLVLLVAVEGTHDCTRACLRACARVCVCVCVLCACVRVAVRRPRL
jgi:hypothetical protein